MRDPLGAPCQQKTAPQFSEANASITGAYNHPNISSIGPKETVLNLQASTFSLASTDSSAASRGRVTRTMVNSFS